MKMKPHLPPTTCPHCGAAKSQIARHIFYACGSSLAIKDGKTVLKTALCATRVELAKVRKLLKRANATIATLKASAKPTRAAIPTPTRRLRPPVRR